jgi:hypothetical protein
VVGLLQRHPRPHWLRHRHRRSPSPRCGSRHRAGLTPAASAGRQRDKRPEQCRRLHRVPPAAADKACLRFWDGRTHMSKAEWRADALKPASPTSRRATLGLVTKGKR